MAQPSPDLGDIIPPLLWKFSVSEVVSSMVAVAQGIESACGNPSPVRNEAQGYNGDLFNPIQRWASRAHHRMPGCAVCGELRSMAKSLQAATLGDVESDEFAPADGRSFQNSDVTMEEMARRAFEQGRASRTDGAMAATRGTRIG